MHMHMYYYAHVHVYAHALLSIVKVGRCPCPHPRTCTCISTCPCAGGLPHRIPGWRRSRARPRHHQRPVVRAVLRRLRGQVDRRASGRRAEHRPPDPQHARGGPLVQRLGFGHAGGQPVRRSRPDRPIDRRDGRRGQHDPRRLLRVLGVARRLPGRGPRRDGDLLARSAQPHLLWPPRLRKVRCHPPERLPAMLAAISPPSPAISPPCSRPPRPMPRATAPVPPPRTDERICTASAPACPSAAVHTSDAPPPVNGTQAAAHR